MGASVKKNENGLTQLQQAFVNEYLNNGYNARKALMTVRPDYKDTSYDVVPYQILKIEHVKNYIDKHREEVFESLHIDAKRVLSALSDIAFDEKLKPRDKTKALELLGKWLNLYDKDTNRGTEPQQIRILLEGNKK